MSSRHVRDLGLVWEAIIHDATHTYPHLRLEFQRDIATQREAVTARGIRFYALDLPLVAKHLDRCLDDGKYVPGQHIPFTGRVSRAVVIPKFLRGLYLLIFDGQSGLLRQDVDIHAICFLRQLLLVGKKIDLECSPSAVEDAIADLVDTDNSLPVPSDWWDSECYEDINIGFADNDFFHRATGSDSSDVLQLTRILDTVSGILTATLGPYDSYAYRCKHGPGAVSERTGPFDKYNFSNWSDRLEAEFPSCDFAYHNFASWARNYEELGNIERYSRLIAVRKTLDKPRLIAAEPSENQWCQQNIWHYMDSAVRRTWISRFVRFRDQTLNQDLCLKGSVGGSLCTIDLSAASDRVSCDAVQALFRGNPPLLRALRATRTRGLRISQLGIPFAIRLRKFSTMGSSCTFPVETLLFLACTLSAVLYARRLQPTVENILSLTGEVAVFGDDIVVPRDSRTRLVTLLEALAFKVNKNKSYEGGNFRESCGVDAFRGHVVTPVYWKGIVTEAPESVVRTVATRNLFYERFLLATAQVLTSALKRYRKIPFVRSGSGAFGFATREKLLLTSARMPRRWSKSLHCWMVRVLVPVGKRTKIKTEGDPALLQYFTEDPDPTIKWEVGYGTGCRTYLGARWVPSSLLGYT